jgi:hypothetical protein
VASEIEKYQRGKFFSFPFFVAEDALRRVDEVVRKRLAHIPVGPKIDFDSQTRFPDLSTLRFDDFDQFLREAGDKKDPEQAHLVWNKFAVDANGEPIAGEVRVTFTTEKRLETQDIEVGAFMRASVDLLVSSSDSDWAAQTFADVTPHIEATRMGGVLRPLWIFRNRYVVQVLAMALSWISFFTGASFASRQLSVTARLSESQVLQKLVSTNDLRAKINILATQWLTPSNDPWWHPIVVIGCGALAFAIIYTAGITLLPKLTPNSAIAIGLANRRAQQSLNTFKFIVFVLLISGILVPLLREIILRLI